MSKKGCVYFMQIRGLSPVKIGMTSCSDPFTRCAQIGKSAPYGYDIVGYISTADFVLLEIGIHHRFSSKRINGEWFEITTADCIDAITAHGGVVLFGTDASSFRKKVRSFIYNGELSDTPKMLIRDAYLADSKFSRRKLADSLGITDRMVRKHLATLKANGHV